MAEYRSYRLVGYPRLFLLITSQHPVLNALSIKAYEAR